MSHHQNLSFKKVAVITLPCVQGCIGATHPTEVKPGSIPSSDSEASATNVTAISRPSNNLALILSSLINFLSLLSNSFPVPVTLPLTSPPVIFKRISSGEESLADHVPCACSWRSE